MIVLASGLIIYGLSMIYGITGSLNFWAVKDALLNMADKRLLIVAFTFMIAGYAVEAAIVPFHVWLPDVYTAAPSSTSALMSSMMDQASYYVLIRVLLYILTPTTIVNWTFAIAVLSALTMIIGNLFALVQNDVKRMLAYVCIVDVGYNLIAITSFTALGVEANLFFFLVGGLSTALAFMCVGIFMGLEKLEDFSGLVSGNLKIGFPLIIVSLSFLGMPPLAGFWAKYMVFTSAIEGNMFWLAFIGIMCSVIESAYFLRLIHVMCFKPKVKEIDANLEFRKALPIYILVGFIILLGVFPTIVLNLIVSAGGQI
jgi:NADH-quinone oxidoreductase subunit N